MATGVGVVMLVMVPMVLVVLDGEVLVFEVASDENGCASVGAFFGSACV